ncbi:hypothetical protein KY361_07695 [Candidatus Woesearchaeota archaeon]|nr:hypothetical protein [Candidatus Woesearchaeota archaeon]
MPKKIISLNVDKEVYSRYSKRCREKGMIISKQVENFMKKRLEESKED